MTASDRFDLRVAELFDDVAPPTYPDYFDDVLASATARRQRPAWTFPERWIPVSAVARRIAPAPSIPWRTVGLVALLVLLLVTVAIGVGSQRRVPAPFGPAGNGVIAYARDGDIYTRPTVDGPERLIIGGPEVAVAPFFSLDGTKVAYYVLEPDEKRATLFVAAPDGSDRQAVLGPDEIVSAAWSPASDRLAVVHGSAPRSLTLVEVDGEIARTEVDLGSIRPWNLAEWRPPNGGELIFQGYDDRKFAIYGIDPDGGEPRRLTDPGTEIETGGWYSMSADGRYLAYTRSADTVRLRLLDLVQGTDREFGAALPPPAAGSGVGLHHHGHPVFSPDGTHIAFGRYWDERDGEINHQTWIASASGDGSDAIAIAPLLRSSSGNNPFWVTYAPDGGSLLVKLDEGDGGWIAYPDGRAADPLEMGILTDAPVWQRTLR